MRLEKNKTLLNLDLADFNSKREQVRIDIDTDVKTHEELRQDSQQRNVIRDRLAKRISRTAPFSIAARQYLSAHRYLDWVTQILQHDTT